VKPCDPETCTASLCPFCLFEEDEEEGPTSDRSNYVVACDTGD